MKEDDPQQPQASEGEGADLAQAYRDLQRGEQAAAAMEANLTNLESKLDALLAAAEKTAEEAEAAQGADTKGDGKEESTDKSKGSS